MSESARSASQIPYVTTRSMEPADVPAVHAIQVASPQAAQWDEDSLRRRPESDYRIVVEAGRTLAGFALARRAADELEILNIAVLPEFRRRGLARELLHHLLPLAAAEGVVRVFLEVRESNAAARRFYESQGFRECGRRARYYRDPAEDAILLAREMLALLAE